MQKYHVHIKADSESDLKEELREAAFLLTGLYESVEASDKSYGGAAKQVKNEWKAKVKAWVEKRKTYIQQC